MFLYEEDKKNIRVYNYLIDEQKLYDFKKEQMAKIKEEERLLRAVTNYCYYPLEEKKKILAYSDLNYEVDKNFGHSSYYHFLSPYEMNEEELERQRKFLEKYYHFAGAHGSQYYMLYGYEKYTEKVIDLILNKDENDITRLDLLNEVKNMINHNIMCYSSDLLLKKPKQGYEKEFATENKKLILIEQIIKEEREKEKIKDKKVKSKSKER